MFLLLIDESLPTATAPIITKSSSISEKCAIMSSADIHDHSTTIHHPYNTPGPEVTPHQSQNQLGSHGMPTPLQVFQDQSTEYQSEEYPILLTESIQDSGLDLSKQELVMFKDGSVTTSIKQAIEEKTNEIQRLKTGIINLQDSLHEAELREKYCQADNVKKDEEIKSLKESNEIKLADKDKELEKVQKEVAQLRQSQKEREKELMDELAQTKEEYNLKLLELTETKDKYMCELLEVKHAKEVEHLKLRLKHSEETKGLQLQIKDLQHQLIAGKEAMTWELEKKEKESQRLQQLEEKKATIWELKEKQKESQQLLEEKKGMICELEKEQKESQREQKLKDQHKEQGGWPLEHEKN